MTLIICQSARVCSRSVKLTDGARIAISCVPGYGRREWQVGVPVFLVNEQTIDAEPGIRSLNLVLLEVLLIRVLKSKTGQTQLRLPVAAVGALDGQIWTTVGGPLKILHLLQ